MIEIKNKKGNYLKIFTSNVEESALKQLKNILNFEAYEDSKIRVMPDCHAGKGCTIGTTMVIKDKITPNLVGVDIGCGMLTIKIKEKDLDLKKIDEIINKYIPSGKNIHNISKKQFDYSKLKSFKYLRLERLDKSIGTLGGGNHFIEIAKNSKDELFIIIHSGSRHLGAQVAKYYQDLAWKLVNDMSFIKDDLIKKLKKDKREKDIQKELKKLKKPKANKELAYLTGDYMNDYLHDMKLTQEYAILNRRTIGDIILKEAKLTEIESFETIHNYIDFDRMILRKGAIRAEKDEIVLIPLNMKDGSLLCKGKGNEDWNFSAPHGAGRRLSRSKAKENLNLKDFKKSMKNIYTTSVNKNTLDEAPGAYKPVKDIINNITDTVVIIDRLLPIYNFKAH